MNLYIWHGQKSQISRFKQTLVVLANNEKTARELVKRCEYVSCNTTPSEVIKTPNLISFSEIPDGAQILSGPIIIGI